MSAVSPTNSSSNFSWHNALPTHSTVQHGLFAFSVATSALSVIPHLRFAGAVATRTITLLSSSISAAKSTVEERFAKYATVATVAAGLIGVAAASPMLIAASLASDIGLQALDTAIALQGGEIGKAFAHVSFITVDALALAATFTGLWQLMATAALVNSCVMIGFMFASVDRETISIGQAIRVLGYWALMGISMYNTLSCTKLTKTTPVAAQFSETNTADEKMLFYNKQGQVVAEAPPGATIHFEVPYADTLQHISYKVIPSLQNDHSIVPWPSGAYVNAVHFGQNNASMSMTKCDATHIDLVTKVLREPLSIPEFTQLPLGCHHNRSLA